MTILSTLTLTKKTKASMLSSELMGMGCPSARDGTGPNPVCHGKDSGLGRFANYP